MTNSYEQKAIDDLKAVAPEFAKLTQDFLFDDIWKRPGLSQRAVDRAKPQRTQRKTKTWALSRKTSRQIQT
jgi:alkylhydroperoxidase/carboxymuconolactone decarboxylase family protein YurZ